VKNALKLVGLTALLATILVVANVVASRLDLHTPPPGIGPESPTPTSDHHPVIIVTIQPEVTR